MPSRNTTPTSPQPRKVPVTPEKVKPVEPEEVAEIIHSSAYLTDLVEEEEEDDEVITVKYIVAPIQYGIE